MIVPDQSESGILKPRLSRYTGILTQLVTGILIFLSGTPIVQAQSCDCPLPANCAPCAGGITVITLRFNGMVAANVIATDSSGEIFNRLLAPNENFTLTGTKQDGKFEGPHIDFTIDGVDDVRVKTNCDDVQINKDLGSFTVIASESKNGGPLCCQPEDIDATPPVIDACPVDMAAVLPSNACTVAVTWTSPTATDDCELVTFTTDREPGSMFAVGTTTVTYTATDDRGNKSTCAFDVTVTDETLPVFSSCPDDITIPLNLLCVAVATWTPPTATDNCAVTVEGSHTPGSTFPVGTTTVTYTATDASGNKATCSFDVFVNDIVPPVITFCPADRTVSSASGCAATVSWLPPTYIEVCPGTLTSTHDPGDSFPIGTTTVTYTAMDAAGNSATCSFDITVEDESPPTMTNCPVDISASAATSCSARVTWTAPSTSDSCPVTLTASHNPGATFPIGITTVTYTARDTQGNTSSCSFDVIVNDDIDPKITGCPSNISKAASSSCQAVVSWTPPTATDACPFTLTSSHQPGSSFLIGTTTVTYTAKDAYGNTSICSFDVTVTDDGNPTFAGCPDDISVPTTTSCAAVVSWTPPSSSDSCPVTFTSSHQPGSSFPIGTTTVTYTATDSQNNTSTCNFTVTVTDESNPTLTGCPQDILAGATSSCRATVSWTPPTAQDNCNITLTSNREPGSTFPIGTTTVTYTATDPSGKKSTCSFKVIVSDKEPPTFTACPTEIVAMATSDCQATATWSPPLASDNCDKVSITSTHTPGSIFPGGTTLVTYTATDAAGNSSTCEFNVLVSTGDAPMISGCPDSVVVNTVEGDATATWEEPGASVQCGEVTTESTHSPGQVFPVGTTDVVYTFTDDAGSTATCTFTVTVKQDNVSVQPAKAVTPDGDGKNDIWWVNNIEKFSDNMVVIVDRWGNKVYQATGYDNQRVFWNGNNSSGARVPTGTYFFTIELKTDKTRVRQKGFIEVVQ
jgi:gliding motility-associated-like protein